jgi:hypothetical protein|tara:strand:+ start:691 stop:828 length:138 start_codon:yes stop_codon:yes gene_type:complete
MDSCCTRERKKKEYLFLPLAVIGCVGSLAVLLGIEMAIFYSLGLL